MPLKEDRWEDAPCSAQQSAGTGTGTGTEPAWNGSTGPARGGGAATLLTDKDAGKSHLL